VLDTEKEDSIVVVLSKPQKNFYNTALAVS